MKGVFVTSTGTGAGKTTITASLARLLRARGLSPCALKPLETGVDPVPADALALAEACGRPELATMADWYRARSPVSPYAATLEGHPPPDLDRLLAALRRTASGGYALIEGAGGLLVPLDRHHTTADLAARLGLPLLLVVPDRLGVLSDTLSIVASAAQAGLSPCALVLSQGSNPPDPSARFNAHILSERLDFPVVVAPWSRTPSDLDTALAESPLLERLASL